MKNKLLIFLIFITMLLLVGCSLTSTSSNENKNGLSLKKESKYFKFYSNDKDVDYIDDLDSVLKDKYKSITKDLNISFKDKIEVEIYPDIDSLHNALGTPNGNHRIAGNGWNNNIKIVSPLNPGTVHDYKSILKVAAHEFAHVAICNINSDLNSIPVWLTEGFATYTSEEVSMEGKSVIVHLVKENMLPTLNDLNTNFANIKWNYYISYSICDFFINTYGYEKLIQLIKSPMDIENITELSIENLEKKWISYINEHY